MLFVLGPKVIYRKYRVSQKTKTSVMTILGSPVISYRHFTILKKCIYLRKMDMESRGKYVNLIEYHLYDIIFCAIKVTQLRCIAIVFARQ